MSFLWPYFARRPSRISRIRRLNCPGLVKMRFGGGKNSIVLNLLPFENSSRPLRATFHESTINISRNIYIYIYESFVASNKESQQDSKRISNSERNSPHLLQRFVTHRLMDSRSVIPLWNRSLDSIELVSPIVLLHTRYVIGNCFQKRETIFQRYIYGDEYIFFFFEFICIIKIVIDSILVEVVNFPDWSNVVNIAVLQRGRKERLIRQSVI